MQPDEAHLIFRHAYCALWHAIVCRTNSEEAQYAFLSHNKLAGPTFETLNETLPENMRFTTQYANEWQAATIMQQLQDNSEETSAWRLFRNLVLARMSEEIKKN